MGVPPEETLVVGDYHLDIEAGRAAGAMTAYLTPGTRGARRTRHRRGRPPGTPTATSWCPPRRAATTSSGSASPLPHGKLPNELLAGHLRRPAGAAAAQTPGARLLRARHPGAAIGEDVTALDIADADDARRARRPHHAVEPATCGRYAVLVNANDIATSGAEPRWLLTTVLLPSGTTALRGAGVCWPTSRRRARRAGIALVGGHTEVSDAVTRPVVSGTMLGTSSPRRICATSAGAARRP